MDFTQFCDVASYCSQNNLLFICELFSGFVRCVSVCLCVCARIQANICTRDVMLSPDNIIHQSFAPRIPGLFFENRFENRFATKRFVGKYQLSYQQFFSFVCLHCWGCWINCKNSSQAGGIKGICSTLLPHASPSLFSACNKWHNLRLHLLTFLMKKINIIQIHNQSPCYPHTLWMTAITMETYE